MTPTFASRASATVTATVARTTSKEAACASIASTTPQAINVKSAFQTFSMIPAKSRPIRPFACVCVGYETVLHEFEIFRRKVDVSAGRLNAMNCRC